ncbi:hypothetical protein ILFOPFJJ_06170 [Ensifer psoraleae]|uniref:hypothetical protein n=1 Tax=Sinorhizobium psoraleae TaxID=520838 RepID=UPI0015697AD5|nr:hypothetical protein [Sinorhizobium psoraleae]NRP75247.1 hypothetical protein [Sinorhizobium psoraleae]
MSVDFDFYLAVRAAREHGTKHPSWVEAWFAPARIGKSKEPLASREIVDVAEIEHRCQSHDVPDPKKNCEVQFDDISAVAGAVCVQSIQMANKDEAI